jgi:phosphate transport system substrate-binding protein
VQNGLAYADLINRAGRTVAPTAAAFAAAASGATWDAGKGFYLLLLDRPEPDAWPITGATFVLMRRDAPAAKRAAVHRFFDWAFASGDAAAARLDYVPLPAPVKAEVRQSWGVGLPASRH